jgi:hypothetical protein
MAKKDSLRQKMAKRYFLIEIKKKYFSQKKTIYLHKSKVLLDEIFTMFNNINCPHLAGKPKLFFIQSCRDGNFNIYLFCL